MIKKQNLIVSLAFMGISAATYWLLFNLENFTSTQFLQKVLFAIMFISGLIISISNYKYFNNNPESLRYLFVFFFCNVPFGMCDF